MAKSANTKAHESQHRHEIEELLSRFPVTGRDRFWSAEPVARRGFAAAHRVFEKRFENQLNSKSLDKLDKDEGSKV